jgi:hypothetical protein
MLSQVIPLPGAQNPRDTENVEALPGKPGMEDSSVGQNCLWVQDKTHRESQLRAAPVLLQDLAVSWGLK